MFMGVRLQDAAQRSEMGWNAVSCDANDVVPVRRRWHNEVGIKRLEMDVSMIRERRRCRSLITVVLVA